MKLPFTNIWDKILHPSIYWLPVVLLVSFTKKSVSSHVSVIEWMSGIEKVEFEFDCWMKFEWCRIQLFGMNIRLWGKLFKNTANEMFVSIRHRIQRNRNCYDILEFVKWCYLFVVVHRSIASDSLHCSRCSLYW